MAAWLTMAYDKTGHKHGATFECNILMANSRMVVLYTLYVVACLLDLSLMKVLEPSQ